MANEKILDVEMVDVGFESSNEPWLPYNLADGNIIELRMMLTSVKKLISRDPTKDDPNNPVYQFQMGGVMRVRKAGKLGPEKVMQ